MDHLKNIIKEDKVDAFRIFFPAYREKGDIIAKWCWDRIVHYRSINICAELMKSGDELERRWKHACSNRHYSTISLMVRASLLDGEDPNEVPNYLRKARWMIHLSSSLSLLVLQLYLSLGYVIKCLQCDNYYKMWILLSTGVELTSMNLHKCRVYSMKDVTVLSCLSIAPQLHAFVVEDVNKHPCLLYALHDNGASVREVLYQTERHFGVDSFAPWVIEKPILLPLIERMIVNGELQGEELRELIKETEHQYQPDYLELFTRRKMIDRKPLLFQIKERVGKILRSLLD